MIDEPAKSVFSVCIARFPGQRSLVAPKAVQIKNGNVPRHRESRSAAQFGANGIGQLIGQTLHQAGI
jgi:hypothetical protein